MKRSTCLACDVRMKKVSLANIGRRSLLPFILFVAASLFTFNTATAQIIDETFEESAWHPNSSHAGNSGTTSGKVFITATSASSTVTYYTVQNSTLTSTRINTTPNSGTWWYSKAQSSSDTKLNKVHSITHSLQLATSGYVITPVTKSAFVSVTFWAALQVPMYVAINPNTNAVQASYSSGSTAANLNAAGFTYASQTFASAGNSSMTLYSYTGTFSGPARIGFFNTAGSSIYIDDITVIGPSGTPPTIITNSVTPAQNTATIFGTITPGTMPLLASGVIWSASNSPMDTTVSTKTRNTPSATGAYSNLATGLTPATCYFGRAYVIDLAGNVYYGVILPFCTSAATAPTLTTAPAYNIRSYKASGGGSSIDSGGLAITDKGLCWSTSPNPTVISSKVSGGKNGNDFSALMRVLTPCTTYYVRAYAVNAAGTGYGNEVQFQAACPAQPALIASPLSINFGSIPYNTSSTVFNYTLTGYNLTPTSGNITVTPPAGYTLSLSPTAGFTSPLAIPYSGSGLATKTIYVKLATSSYGTFNGGITHTGGGVVVQDADTVNVTGMIIPDPTITTNLGTDFWTGFGYQEKMSQKAGNSGEAKLSIYISVPAGSQAASVNVDLPGIPGAAGFPKQNLSVAGGSVVEVKDFPTGDINDEENPNGLPDTRLYYTGVSKRGIHVYSTNGVPISVWIHSYTSGNSAAGAMLFPTNTWNNSYTVQAFGGYSNNSNPNSFFFVIANEDNTPIWVKPSEDVVDSITGSSGTIFNDGHTATQVKYSKGIEYGPIYLNKGQIFNAMGFIQGSGSGISSGKAFGLDLTGSTVRTTCDKKIAVFGGNGRCLINGTGCNASSGSDHMIQQMFPSVAWGTKYLTVPTKTMEFNVFRINVSDPATQVWVNNPTHTTALTGLVNNLYYQIQSTGPLMIESDKPVTVTQFIVAGGCANTYGSKGQGDPEMIILSPVQQSINNATVYSALMKGPGASYNGHYINVVIRKGGIASFRLDGLNTADTGINQTTATATTCYNTGGTIPLANAFIKHPGDTNYYYAKLRVAPGAAHRLYSDSTFNAIAYGMGDGESYGYNAGTNIKDLTKPLFIDNPYLQNNTNNTSCTNNPIILKAVLPYPPNKVDSITWYMGSIAGVNPQADITIHNPASDSTFVLDGVSYYVYKNPVTYTFSSAGSYNITGIAGGTFASQCGSTSLFNFNINIVDPGFADFTINYNPCVNDTVHFVDASSGNGFPVSGWRWQFGDGTVDTVNQNPAKVYAVHSTYNVSLRAINSIGCYADITKLLDMTSILTAKFGVADTICAGSTVTFYDSSTNAGLAGSITKWYWDYGDTIKDTFTVSTNPTHSFPAGTYYVKLKVETAAGCTAEYTDTIIIRPNPAANFTPPAGVCLPGATTFTNTTTISDGTIAGVTYLWNFGDATTSTATSPSHTYPNNPPPPGGYNVVLTATSQYGCVATKTTALTAVYTKPVAAFTVSTNTCLGDSLQFNDGSSGTSQTINNWYWSFGDGTHSALQNPKHLYTTYGNYNVTLAVVSDKGCASDTSAAIAVKVNPRPDAGFIVPAGCLGSGTIIFVDTSSITPNDGTQQPFTYSWNFGDPGSGAANTSTAQNGQHTFTAAGNYTIIQYVTSANSCKDTASVVFNIVGTKPVPNFTVLTTPLCANKSVSIQNTTTNAIGAVTKIEIAWDNGVNPTVVETFNNPTSSQVFTHTYPVFNTLPARTYQIRIRAFSGTTCFDDVTKPVTINPSPTTTFGAISGVCLGTPAFTLNQGSQTSALPGSFFYSGNGVTNANGTFSSTVAGAAIHQLQYLYVTSAGCRDSSTSSIEVWALPAASFSVSPVKCEKNAIVFTSTSTPGAGTINSYSWNFGDATALQNGASTPHTFSVYNTYNVSLQISTNNGCSASASLPVLVNPLPVVDFNPPTTPVCLPDGRASFTDATTIPNGGALFSYFWTFGDGGLSLQKDPTHQYSAVANYQVRLRVTNTNTGCIDSAAKFFANILPQPKTSITTNPVSGEVCLGDSIQFTGNVVSSTSSVTKWVWSLGDGDVDSVQTFWHTYDTSKTFTASVHFYNAQGCVSDTITKTVIIDAFPVVSTPGPVYVLEGHSITLNPVIGSSSGTTQYLWESYPGVAAVDLNTDNIRNPICTPITDRIYILTVTNGLGCSASDTLEVNLYRTPVVPNAFSPNGDGINDVFNVRYLSTYSTARIEIFNRYGQKVWGTTGYDKPWDGTMNGKPLAIGVYYYVIHLGIIDKPITGSITLLR
jgi:gliding motility-associated-like protein